MNVVNFKTESHFSLSLGPLFYILHVVLLKILFLAWGKYKPFLYKPAQETLYWDTHVMKFGPHHQETAFHWEKFNQRDGL